MVNPSSLTRLETRIEESNCLASRTVLGNRFFVKKKKKMRNESEGLPWAQSEVGRRRTLDELRTVHHQPIFIALICKAGEASLIDLS